MAKLPGADSLLASAPQAVGASTGGGGGAYGLVSNVTLTKNAPVGYQVGAGGAAATGAGDTWFCNATTDNSVASGTKPKCSPTK